MAAQPPAIRRRVWITGFVFLLLIISLAVMTARAGIESDLAAKARDQLTAAGYAWLDVSVSGRDITLEGAVFSESDKKKAKDALRKVWGIGDVESRLKIAVRDSPYKLSIKRTDKQLKLRGSVPNEDARKTILGLANANFPGIDISAEFMLDPSLADQDRWLTGVGFALSQLKHVAKGRAVLKDSDLSFKGRASKPGAYENVRQAFREAVPDGISVAQVDVKPLTVRPFTWKIQMQNGKVILGGYTPSRMAKAAMVHLVRRIFPDFAVIDTTSIADGAPERWLSSARIALGALEHLRAGSVTLSDTEIELEGVAKSLASYRSIAELKNAWPSGYSFESKVRYSPLEPASSPDDRGNRAGLTKTDF